MNVSKIRHKENILRTQTNLDFGFGGSLMLNSPFGILAMKTKLDYLANLKGNLQN